MLRIFKFEVTLNNRAFKDGLEGSHELARILRELADDIEGKGDLKDNILVADYSAGQPWFGVIRDSNNVECGHACVEVIK